MDAVLAVLRQAVEEASLNASCAQGHEPGHKTAQYFVKDPQQYQPRYLYDGGGLLLVSNPEADRPALPARHLSADAVRRSAHKAAHFCVLVVPDAACDQELKLAHETA